MSLDQDDIQKSPESSNQVFQESSSEINGTIYSIPSNEFDSHFGSEPSRGGSGGPIKKIRKVLKTFFLILKSERFLFSKECKY